MNFRALRSFSQKEMVKGLPQIDHVEQICEGCLVGKQQRKPFPQSSLYRAEELLELVHGDLCGPITPETLAGNQHFLLLVDDCSRHMWVVLLKKNDQSLDAFKKIKARIEVETNIKPKAFRSDRGGEFNSKDFEYYDKQGLKKFTTTPYSPQQNGVAERRNQNVVAMA